MRCVFAEWPLLPCRLVRSRLGVWLGLLTAVLWRLAHGVSTADPAAIAVLTGTLAAVLCTAALAGLPGDRAALAHRLLQPTSSLAIAAGRWLAATSGACAVVLVLAASLGWSPSGTVVHSGAIAAGMVAAGAVSAVVLCGVLVWGNAIAVLAFLWLLLVSVAPPEALIGIRHHGVVTFTGAALLEIGPAVWRYRGIATGDPGAVAHAAVWVGVGIALATWGVARLGARPL
jgi:hypothetical protein